VRAHFDGQRWSEMFELLYGNAGIALGALHAGDIELALVAVTPYLDTRGPDARRGELGGSTQSGSFSPHCARHARHCVCPGRGRGRHGTHRTA
jgi:hypothetical protein